MNPHESSSHENAFCPRAKKFLIRILLNNFLEVVSRDLKKTSHDTSVFLMLQVLFRITDYGALGNFRVERIQEDPNDRKQKLWEIINNKDKDRWGSSVKNLQEF